MSVVVSVPLAIPFTGSHAQFCTSIECSREVGGIISAAPPTASVEQMRRARLRLSYVLDSATVRRALLFPAHADFIRAVGKEAGDSRIWAGIHFQMDNLAGAQLGTSVANVFITRAKTDGSQ